LGTAQLPADPNALRDLQLRKLKAGLVEQLFLTLSPAIAGRERGSTQIGLVEGTSLLPGIDIRGRLLSARRSGSHLFLRYQLS